MKVTKLAYQEDLYGKWTYEAERQLRLYSRDHVDLCFSEEEKRLPVIG